MKVRNAKLRYIEGEYYTRPVCPFDSYFFTHCGKNFKLQKLASNAVTICYRGGTGAGVTAKESKNLQSVPIVKFQLEPSLNEVVSDTEISNVKLNTKYQNSHLKMHGKRKTRKSLVLVN